MTDENQLPDWRDEKALAKWLEQFPRPLLVALAHRMALLALPGLGTLTPAQLKSKWAPALLMSCFRASTASLVAAKYPTKENVFAAATAARSKVLLFAVDLLSVRPLSC